MSDSYVHTQKLYKDTVKTQSVTDLDSYFDLLLYFV